LSDFEDEKSEYSMISKSFKMCAGSEVEDAEDIVYL